MIVASSGTDTILGFGGDDRLGGDVAFVNDVATTGGNDLIPAARETTGSPATTSLRAPTSAGTVATT